MEKPPQKNSNESTPQARFRVLLGLFGTEKARENFISLCRDYNVERASQVATSGDSENYRRKKSVEYSPPKRAALHNQIMETIGRIATQVKKPTVEQEEMLREFHSREKVAEAIHKYFLDERGGGGGGEELNRRDMSETAYFHSLGKEH